MNDCDDELSEKRRHFALIEISFLVELKVTKNKQASRKQCCGVSMPKKSALINARMIEKMKLPLFIYNSRR